MLLIIIQIHIYKLDGNNLVANKELEHLGAITDCKYSPDGKYLTACDANRKVITYNVEEYQVSFLNLCNFHTNII